MHNDAYSCKLVKALLNMNIERDAAVNEMQDCTFFP